jgi:hypothetical protein
MQQKVLHGLVMAAVLVLISGASYLLGTQNQSSSQTASEDSEFTTYTSEALGFSMKIPKSLPGYDFCETKRQAFTVPMKVIEDTKYGIAYFVPEHYYNQPSEWDEKKEKTIYSGECQKKIFSLDSFEDYKGRIVNPFLGIAMKVGTFQNDEDPYSEFISSAYGKCVEAGHDISSVWQPLGYWQTETKLKDGYDYLMDTTGVFERHECGIGGVFIVTHGEKDMLIGMTYYPGQESAFYPDVDGRMPPYDTIMFQSFRFTD